MHHTPDPQNAHVLDAVTDRESRQTHPNQNRQNEHHVSHQLTWSAAVQQSAAPEFQQFVCLFARVV